MIAVLTVLILILTLMMIIWIGNGDGHGFERACSTPCQVSFLSRCSLKIKMCRCWKEITSAQYAAMFSLARRTSPPISEVTTKSNHLRILRTQPARPRCTTVVSVERCSPPSHPLTATCSYTRGSVRSRASSAVRLSQRTATCTGTRERME